MFKLGKLSSALWRQTRISVVKAHSSVKISWQFSSPFLLFVPLGTGLLISLCCFPTGPGCNLITSCSRASPRCCSPQPQWDESLEKCACTWLPVNFSQWSYSLLFITTSYPPLPHQYRISLQYIYRCRDRVKENQRFSVIYHICYLNILNLITRTVLTNPTSLSVYRDICWSKASRMLGNIFIWLSALGPYINCL